MLTGILKCGCERLAPACARSCRLAQFGLAYSDSVLTTQVVVTLLSINLEALYRQLLLLYTKMVGEAWSSRSCGGSILLLQRKITA